MSTTAPKPFVFVLMPFAPEFDDVYQLGIKPACEKAGAYAERLDQQLFTESILDRIYNQISKADVIVSDMTGRNPNVFYETGYAHALGKKVILLTQTADDIPSDLKHYQHIIYARRISDLIPQLQRKLSWALQQPNDETLPHRIKFYFHGEQLSEDAEIKLSVRENSLLWSLTIDAHNPIDMKIKEVRCRFGILIGHTSTLRFEHLGSSDFEHFRQPDGNDLYIMEKGVVLSPGSWKSFEFSFRHPYPPKRIQVGDFVSATIRTFSQDGIADLPFSITAVELEQA